MKRAARSALSLIFILGVIVALWPLGQRTYGLWSQYKLRSAWHAEAAATQHGKAASTTKRSHPRPKAGLLKPVAHAKPQEAKWPPTEIVIPDIGLDSVVVQGVQEADLRSGPGHYPPSALPGAAGNCVIAGHRNLYGSWFDRVNELQPGATIRLRTPRETFTYQVLNVDMVTDTDTSVMESRPTETSRPQLTLITCTTPLSSNRIIVRAEMPSEEEISQSWQ